MVYHIMRGPGGKSWEGVGVLRDKELKLEEVEAVTEAAHTLGGSTSLRPESVKADEKACKE
jgi:hypothetical protein